jgi:hypothetical protein
MLGENSGVGEGGPDKALAFIFFCLIVARFRLYLESPWAG